MDISYVSCQGQIFGLIALINEDKDQIESW